MDAVLDCVRSKLVRPGFSWNIVGHLRCCCMSSRAAATTASIMPITLTFFGAKNGEAKDWFWNSAHSPVHAAGTDACPNHCAALFHRASHHQSSHALWRSVSEDTPHDVATSADGEWRSWKWKQCRKHWPCTENTAGVCCLPAKTIISYLDFVTLLRAIP